MDGDLIECDILTSAGQLDGCFKPQSKWEIDGNKKFGSKEEEERSTTQNFLFLSSSDS